MEKHFKNFSTTKVIPFEKNSLKIESKNEDIFDFFLIQTFSQIKKHIVQRNFSSHQKWTKV